LLLAQLQLEQQAQTLLSPTLAQAARLRLTSPFLVATLALLDPLAQLDHKDRKVFRGILGLREQQDQQEPQALLQPLPLVRPLLVRQAQTHP
jgi:hypothetical protein